MVAFLPETLGSCSQGAISEHCRWGPDNLHAKGRENSNNNNNKKCLFEKTKKINKSWGTAGKAFDLHLADQSSISSVPRYPEHPGLWHKTNKNFSKGQKTRLKKIEDKCSNV